MRKKTTVRTAAVLLLFLGLPTVAPADIVSGLLRHWKLDETAAGGVVDATGIGTNGTNHNATVNQTGQIDRAYDFDGSTSYIDFGTGLQLSGNQATFSAFINPESFREGTGAISRNGILGDSGTNVIFTLENSGQLAFTYRTQPSSAGNYYFGNQTTESIPARYMEPRGRGA